MKKLLVLAMAAATLIPAGAQTVTAQAGPAPKYSITWQGADKQTIDTFAKPVDIDEDYQVILTKDVSGDKTKEILLPDWIVSCLVKPADFVGTINGVANQKMPK